MNMLNLDIYKVLFISAILSVAISSCSSPDSYNRNSAGETPPPPNASNVPSVTISAISTSVAYGSGTTVSWTSENATSCTSSGGGGAGTAGSFSTGALTTTTTYVVTCTGAGGSASQGMTITVAPSAITGFVNAGGTGNITAISANDLTSGTIITISGTISYNGTYTVVSATSTNFVIAHVWVNASETETGGWQLAGGMIAGCNTTGASGAINLSNIPSRYNGVAPLTVFFDASATTASATTRPFHDLEYRWGFGDAAGSPVSGTTWATGSRAGVSSRNNATGPVAAHVYETPGSYFVTLTATDGTNTVSNSCAQIVVQDPNVVFSGSNTICVAASSLPVAGAGGCPAGAVTVQQASFPAAISSYATTGKRVLFKRGDTFAAVTEARLTATGPGIVGAYGSGALPIIQMTGNTNVLGFSSSSTPGFKDWRIMDLDMDGMGGNATSGTGISSTGGGLSQVTVLRLTYRNMNNAIGFALDLINYLNNYFLDNARPAEAIHTVDQVAVVDSTVLPGAATVYSAYDSGSRIAFMGNHFDNGGNSSGSHVTRWTYLNKAVISNNNLLRPGFTRLAIKLHAPYWNSTFGVFDPAATQPVRGSDYSAYANGDGYSRHVVIADNKLTDAANPWSVEIGPQDSGSDERIRDTIVERNWWVASSNSQVALRISASEITARNNIFDSSNSTGGQIAMQVVKDGIVVTSDQVRLYNNTLYTNRAVPIGQYAGVSLASPVTNITVRNNLAYAPNASGPVMVENSCGACLTQSNNSSDAQVKNTSPLFASATPANPADFSISTGSYAIGSGTVVPVWSDFFLTARPQAGAFDIGAIKGP